MAEENGMMEPELDMEDSLIEDASVDQTGDGRGNRMKKKPSSPLTVKVKKRKNNKKAQRSRAPGSREFVLLAQLSMLLRDSNGHLFAVKSACLNCRRSKVTERPTVCFVVWSS